jgi:hypothetical protein
LVGYSFLEVHLLYILSTLHSLPQNYSFELRLPTCAGISPVVLMENQSLYCFTYFLFDLSYLSGIAKSPYISFATFVFYIYINMDFPSYIISLWYILICKVLNLCRYFSSFGQLYFKGNCPLPYLQRS